MNSQASSGKVLSILAALVAVAAVSTSIWLNPPSENRARSLDQERLQGLRTTEFAISKYFDIHHALPADLNALDSEKNQPIQANWHDPETHQPLEYKIVNEQSYSLCASFDRNSDWQNPEEYDFKEHSSGRDCFEYNVSPRTRCSNACGWLYHETEFRRVRFEVGERLAAGHCIGTNQNASSTTAPKVR
jgi:hypothetical protein